MRDPRAAELAAQRWVVVEQHGIRQSWCPPNQVERSLSLFGVLLVLAGLAFAFVVALAGGAIALWRRASRGTSPK